MRIEESYGKKIVCGHIFTATEIKIGSIWQSSGGSLVEVVDIRRFIWKYRNENKISYDVFYKWTEGGVEIINDKDSFSFQCRYCLVLEDV